MNTNIKNTVYAHERLASLIKDQFGVFIEVQHVRYPHAVYEGNVKIIAATEVYAFKSLADARSGENMVAFADALCSVHDRFERRKGLTIALRRLYRQLADMKKNDLI